MIHFVNISKSFGSQIIFDNASLILDREEKIGLLGRNGHGKSTLLRMIAGEEQPNSGEIRLPSGTKVGYLRQHLKFNHKSLREEVAAALPDTGIEGFREDFKAERVLNGLGFNAEDFSRPPSEFSGGFQLRIELCKLLVSEPDLLLLDEPTNYLDIVSIRWLEKFLAEWKGMMLLVTHDRRFMDSVSTHTALINRRNIRKIAGNTQKMYEQVMLEEQLHNRTVENEAKKRQQTLRFIERFRAKASKARQVQSRVKAIERQGELATLEEAEELDFYFPEKNFSAKKLFAVKDLCFGYEQSRPLFQGLSFSIAPFDRIAVIGPNGKGKSTLLRVLAGELKSHQGQLNAHPDCVIGYFGQTNVSRLNPEKTVEGEIIDSLEEKNRTRARSICGNMMFPGELALKQVRVLSGGERARVLLGKILASSTNLLLLDEPTNHLDMYSVEAMCCALQEYGGAVIMVSHDEDLIEKLANKLIVFDRGQAKVFNGRYSEFLNELGWSDEDEQAKDLSLNETKRLSKKDLRKMRAEAAEKLRPLDRQYEEVEKQIIEIEGQISRANKEVLEITRDGFGDDAVKLTREIKRNQAKVEDLLNKLEELEQQRNAMKKETLI